MKADAVNATPALRRRRGFTMVEVLLVLVLLAVLGGLLTQNTEQLIRAAEYIPPERHFRDVAAEARLRAFEERSVVWLSFNAESGRFRLVEDTAPPAPDPDAFFDTFDVRPAVPPSRIDEKLGDDRRDPVAESETLEMQTYEGVTVQFFPQLSQEPGADLAEARYADEPIERLRFDPAGYNTPARIVFEYDEGETAELTLDAFSYGPQPRRDDLTLSQF